MLSKLIIFFSRKFRRCRAEIFIHNFDINKNTKILDLGSEDGSHIYSILQGSPFQPHNIFIADINKDSIENGHRIYGFNPVLIQESKQLPFEENFFDIVYCSSVIEHVTVPKTEIWELFSGREFRQRSLQRQMEFANEIKRLGKQYFVQTPYKHFPIESHSWLPLVGWIPRRMLISLLKFTNKFWIKKTSPDWYLLNKKEMSALFDNARIVEEKFCGITKSIMAINSLKG